MIFQVVRDKEQGANATRATYVCAICVKEGKKDLFEGRRAFTQHVKENHNGMIIQCDFCDYKARTMCRIATHRFMIHKALTKNFPIQVCPREGCKFEYVANGELGTHIRFHHDKNYLPGMCPICGIVLQCKYGLQTHIKNVHEGARDHKCDECDKTFKLSFNLKKHKISAHGEGPKVFQVVCDQCGKVCADKVSMRIHIRKDHQKERNYKCSVCGRAFFTKTILRNHERGVHQIGNEFPCPHCEKNFANAYSLKVHVDLHLNKKRFHCRECNSCRTSISVGGSKDVALLSYLIYFPGFTATHTLSLHIATRHMGMSQSEGKKPESIAMAKKHPAYERVSDEDAMIGNPIVKQKLHSNGDRQSIKS